MTRTMYAVAELETQSELDAIVTPSARKLIAEQGLNAGLIKGSGRDGRILKEDVQNYMQASNRSRNSKACSN